MSAGNDNNVMGSLLAAISVGVRSSTSPCTYDCGCKIGAPLSWHLTRANKSVAICLLIPDGRGSNVTNLSVVCVPVLLSMGVFNMTAAADRHKEAMND